jgi:hypothetical protein
MDDHEVREALRDRLQAELARRQAVAAAAAPAEPPLAFYARRLREVAACYPLLPAAIADAFARPLGREVRIDPLALAVRVAVVSALGALAMLVARRLLARWRARLAAPVAASTARVVRALLRLLLGLVEVAAFAGGMLLAYAVLHPTHPSAPLVLHEVLRAAVAVPITDQLLRFLADPDAASLRLLPLPDRGARVLHRVLLTLVVIVAVLGVVVRTLAALGLAPDGMAALALALLLLPSAWLIAMVWRLRVVVTATLAERLGFGGEARQALAVWPALATFYLVLLYAVSAGALLRGEGEIGLRMVASVAAILLVPLLAWLVQDPLRRLYGIDRSGTAWWSRSSPARPPAPPPWGPPPRRSRSRSPPRPAEGRAGGDESSRRIALALN